MTTDPLESIIQAGSALRGLDALPFRAVGVWTDEVEDLMSHSGTAVTETIYLYEIKGSAQGSTTTDSPLDPQDVGVCISARQRCLASEA